MVHMDAYISAGLGALVGTVVVLVTVWLLRKKRYPYMFDRDFAQNTGILFCIFSLVSILIGWTFGITYFIMWMGYAAGMTLFVFSTICISIMRKPEEKK